MNPYGLRIVGANDKNESGSSRRHVRLLPQHQGYEKVISF